MNHSLLVFILLAVILSACGPATTSANPVSETPTVPQEYAGKTNPLGVDAPSQGAEVFKTYCVSCHGSQGLGDGPASQALDPRPANLAQVNHGAGDDFLYWRISTGIPGTAMPAWKGVLTDTQIWQVISFIRTLK